MDHFRYQNGTLNAEAVPLGAIAEDVGTPFYIYTAATLRRHYDVFAENFRDTASLVAFAVKALSNIAVLRLLGQQGAGADIVSGGELARALRAGIPPERIVFSGVGKTRDELAAALAAGIGQFNVESVTELEMLSDVAISQDVTAPVALRINPDVDAGTHDRISTGRKDDKFGIPNDVALEAFDRAAALPGLTVQGLAMHIGSQIVSLEPFERAASAAADMVTTLRSRGIAISTLDLGGGLGIPYAQAASSPPPSDYAKIIRRVTDPLDVKVILEPGRMIAGNAGLFVTQVIRLKQQSSRTFVIVDGAMNDLIRPALYNAAHEIMPGDAPADGASPTSFDVAGPVCESTDVFARDVPLVQPAAGDLLAFRTAGAYGAVQASEYNSRPLVPEVLVDGERYHVIRRRPSLDEMLALESVPDWI